MASGLITSWQIDEETVETVADFIFGGSKITADGDCSHEIKTLLGSKVMTNLDSILKTRDITLITKVHLVKAMVFPAVMYGCESWNIKKADSVIPWTIVYQASLSMGFSRQKYWSRLPFPSPGDLPDPGIKPRSLALQADALPSEPPGKPHVWM